MPPGRGWGGSGRPWKKARDLHRPHHIGAVRGGADPFDDPPGRYPTTVTKLAAFREADARAEAGEDVLTVPPPVRLRPGLVAQRALHRTSFNRVLPLPECARLTAYLAFPRDLGAAADVARGFRGGAALDRGVAGERYLLLGRPEDTISTAAGVTAHVRSPDRPPGEDLDHRSDPEA